MDVSHRLLSTARACLKAGDLPGALAAVRTALPSDPAGVGVLNALGVIAMRMGCTGDAIRHFSRATLLDDAPQSAMNHAMAVETTDDAPAAAVAYEALLARFPDHEPAKARLSRVQCAFGRRALAEGRLAEAEAALLKVLAMAQTEPARLAEAACLLGLTAAGRDEHGRAVALFERALVCEPDLGLAALGMAGSLLDIAWADRACRLQPDAPSAWLTAGANRYMRGLLDRAADDYVRALHLVEHHGPDTIVGDIHLRLARTLLTKDRAAAQAHLQHARRVVDPAIQARVGDCEAEFALHDGDLVEADRRFRSDPAARDPRAAQILATFRCDPAFIDALPPPPDVAMEAVAERGGDVRRVVLVACDGSYLEAFGGMFARSFAATQDSGTLLHVHVCDAPAERIAASAALLDQLGILYRLTRGPLPDGFRAEPRVIYSCMRFLIAPRLLALYSQPLVIADVDAVLEVDIGDFLGSVHADVAVIGKNWIFEPHIRYLAGLMVLRPTAATATLLDRLCAYLSHYLTDGSARWYIDQVGLCACLELARQRELPLAMLDRWSLPLHFRPAREPWEAARRRPPFSLYGA
ncbi:hypothetical protein [Azospirillum sp.]|uniref:tetratricopeptide repeat protein n=1 Tax=Azospirillum sp. TaxID=34012 RepID=UPI002D48962F|nr:hypothetical protein [Azospirillum sp.]HYD63850.1 hypothetical protein [Azospirillum sp.]